MTLSWKNTEAEEVSQYITSLSQSDSEGYVPLLVSVVAEEEERHPIRQTRDSLKSQNSSFHILQSEKKYWKPSAVSFPPLLAYPRQTLIYIAVTVVGENSHVDPKRHQHAQLLSHKL